MSYSYGKSEHCLPYPEENPVHSVCLFVKGPDRSLLCQCTVHYVTMHCARVQQSSCYTMAVTSYRRKSIIVKNSFIQKEYPTWHSSNLKNFFDEENVTKKHNTSLDNSNKN